MTESSRSRTFQLLDTVLAEQGGLHQFLDFRRKQGKGWRVISRDLYLATGVDVSDVSLRKWFTDTEAVA